MEDELLHTRHQAHQLQEMRKRLAPLWDDEAAREINLRFLDPHAEESEALLDAFAKQLTAVTATNTDLQSAERSALAVESLAAEVLEAIDQSDQDLTLCFQMLEQYAQAASIASAAFEQIVELIGRASSICEGVPKS